MGENSLREIDREKEKERQSERKTERENNRERREREGRKFKYAFILLPTMTGIMHGLK
jgi:hypothetical protein